MQEEEKSKVQLHFRGTPEITDGKNLALSLPMVK